MSPTRFARTFVTILAAASCAAPAVAATTPAVADFNTCAKPVWPKEALSQEQQGTVTLAFQISEAGAVTDSKVVKSSGFPMLDLAARDGIMKCRFVPATQDGKPQAAWMKLQYVWTLTRKASDPVAMAAALEADREAAEGGDAAAALRMAKRHLTAAHGTNSPEEQERGAWWLRKAADGGDTQAMEILGSMLLAGRGIARDKADGARWIEQAAEQGSANAQALFGMLLLRGEGVTKNETVAEEWLLKAAGQDHPQAQTQLAILQMQRGAVDAGTIALLERAVERGETAARLMLARCYEQGTGVAQDHAKAFALYARAAASGNSAAKRALRTLHDKGIGLSEDRLAAGKILGLAGAPAGSVPATRAAAGQ